MHSFAEKIGEYQATLFADKDRAKGEAKLNDAAKSHSRSQGEVKTLHYIQVADINPSLVFGVQLRLDELYPNYSSF